MRTVLRDPQTQEAWRQRGAMVPENVKPAEYRQQIRRRIQFFQNFAKTHKIVLEQPGRSVMKKMQDPLLLFR